jgi:energy-coupling factor transporter ATP-binding protein EcfA2
MKTFRFKVFKQYLWMALFVVLVRLVFNLAFADFSLVVAQNALLEGGKLALWVLGFGLFNAAVDIRKLLKRTPSFLSGFTTALTISMSLVPEMANNISRVREASRLRSSRSGRRLVQSVIVPVLSNAVDQAIQLAESMEYRGFGQKTNTELHCTELRLDNFSFGYEEDIKVFDQSSFALTAGQFALVGGDTGSGKSTLLRILKAHYPDAALVGQLPRKGFVSDSVRDELAFALVQKKQNKADVKNRVSAIANEFGIIDFLDQDPQSLSAGWQQRLAIAASMISGADVLLLDEPFSALDEQATLQVLETLARLKEKGTTIVVAEHRINTVAPLADQTFRVENQKLISGLPRQQGLTPCTKTAGRITALVGPNGSGKTTHLRNLAKEAGVLVPQPASDLLFLDSVRAELLQADKDAKAVAGTTKGILEGFQISINLESNPRDLSEGQKLSLALAIQLTKPTSLLLLDEPTLGFDTASRQTLATLICNLAGEGVEIIVATHDHEFANAVATNTITITAGVISNAD